MHQVYLGLGTNLGDKEANLKAALEEIAKRVGEITSQSAFYASEPWGFESNNSFLNAVCGVCTDLSPEETLRTTQEIERTLGRLKKSVNGVYSDRIIDIDILLFDDWQINTPELTIPHPLMWERDFVKIPLKEIAPDINPK
jgi:2-amino-4-hydroxy-6-hydroxymethyldihydropteridine diphosphokinase